MALSNFRYALRSLRRSPGFAFMAVAILALGIGANAAIFSVVYAVLLKPFPYRDPSRLVFVWQRFPEMPAPFSERMFVARRNYQEWLRQNTVFEQMAAFDNVSLAETGGTSPGRVATCFTSASLFPLLGVAPRTGRFFSTDEEGHGRLLAVLTSAYFERRFHSDPKALGSSLTLDDKAYTVIGVLPASFYMPQTFFEDGQPDVFVALPEAPHDPSQNPAHLQTEVAGRLRPGVTLARARTEMAALSERMRKTNPEFYQGGSSSVFSFSEEDTEPSLRRALYVLLAAVGLLLLIACANLANLTLARAVARSRDITVRLALGATRPRIAGQLLTESLLVAFAGAACGLLLAHWSIELMRALKPPDIHRPELIAIDIPVLAFSAAAAALTAILFGLAPALAVSRDDLSSRLKTGGGWGASATRLRSRQFLIACEVALALLLLAGAGLMVRSLERIVATGVGFDTTHLIALDINLPEKRYPDANRRAGLIRELLVRERALPGVLDAAITTALPLHSVSVSNFHIPGRPEPTKDASPITDMALVTPGYFEAIGMRLEAGSWLDESDVASARHPVIVNRAFVNKYFPAENPLGRHLQSGDEKETWEITGVVSDYRALGVEGGPRAEIFRPTLQFTSGTLVLRTRGKPDSVARVMLVQARSVAPDLPADKAKTVAEYGEYWTAQRRFNTLLLAMFASLALLLAMAGIYGVLANLVASRTREIGIRMAMGATTGDIAQLVLRQGLTPVGIGLISGLGGSLALGRFLGALLFQVGAHDPLTLSLALAAILLISPLALYLPLRRATAIDCNVALREE